MENCPLYGNPCSNAKNCDINHGVGEEKMVCSKCAEEYLIRQSEKKIDILMSMIEDITLKYYHDGIKKCSSCDSSFEDLLNKSRLGCDMCYETFKSKILAMFTKCQVGFRHVGKRPKKHDLSGLYMSIDDEIAIYEKKLKEVVDREDYEAAKEIKSKIDSLKLKKV